MDPSENTGMEESQEGMALEPKKQDARGCTAGQSQRASSVGRQPCRCAHGRHPPWGPLRAVRGGPQGWLRRWGRAGCRQGRAVQGGSGAGGRTMRRQWRRAGQGRRGDGGQASARGGDVGNMPYRQSYFLVFMVNKVYLEYSWMTTCID